MNQDAPRYTSDAAGQVYRDGQLYLQLALSTPPDDRKPEAAFVAALLNAADDQGRPGRRIFADGERHEFLRPAGVAEVRLRAREPGSASVFSPRRAGGGAQEA